ncbi:MAG TPA: hypothetical protein VGB61_06420, partial [Pyrinomonadaceae bacterium]
MAATQLLRALPSIDALLRTPEARALGERTGLPRLTALARSVTDELREELRQARFAGMHDANGELSREALLAEAVGRLERAAARAAGGGLRRVVNATGVILHTNLGRAPLSQPARR